MRRLADLAVVVLAPLPSAGGEGRDGFLGRSAEHAVSHVDRLEAAGHIQGVRYRGRIIEGAAIRVIDHS